MSHEIRNDTILLRPLRGADAPALYDAVRESIDLLAPWMPWCNGDYSLSQAQDWIRGCTDASQARMEFAFAIFEPGGRRLLGICGLNFIDWTSLRANLGYWVRTSANNRGIATSAARLLAQYAFDELKLERLEIVAAVDNHTSQQVASKLGALREGVARRRIRIREIHHDGVVFSLLRGDLPAAPLIVSDSVAQTE